MEMYDVIEKDMLFTVSMKTEKNNGFPSWNKIDTQTRESHEIKKLKQTFLVRNIIFLSPNPVVNKTTH